MIKVVIEIEAKEADDLRGAIDLLASHLALGEKLGTILETSGKIDCGFDTPLVGMDDGVGYGNMKARFKRAAIDRSKVN